MKKIIKTKVILVILSFLIGIVFFAGAIIGLFPSEYNENSMIYVKPDRYLRVGGFWNLSPLFINGSGTGVGAHNWSWVKNQIWFGGGNGTLQNPYIIENITIDGGQLPGSCFEIVDSDDYFILRNCTTFYCGSESFDAGIKLDNVNNSKVMFNYVTNNRGNGILLTSSNNNSILNNEITYNDYQGLFVYYSDLNNISNNIIKYNSDYGIYEGHSNLNVFVNNTVILNEGYGLYTSDCEYSQF